jgi:hypothetical protein
MPQSEQRTLLARELNRLLKGTSLYDTARLTDLRLRDKTQALLTQDPKGSELVYLNRLLLEDTFHTEIVRVRYTPGQLLWLNLALFGLIGFLVYTPVMFSGVMALDLTSKKAAATAPGFVGLFGYVGGRVLQGKGLGVIAQNYGWDAGLYSVIGCILIGAVLLAFLWNVKPRG